MANARTLVLTMVFWSLAFASAGADGGRVEPDLRDVLAAAGPNHAEVERALREAPKSQRRGVEFLLRYMPERDLRTFRAEELLEEVGLAHRAREESPWGDRVPDAVFLNDVLPYRVVSEERVPWRRELYRRSRPIIEGARTPAEAAVRLNQEIFPRFGVRYDVERSRTDQNPIQVLEERKATCTGLSVLLIAACRSVGVPARLVGTPLWADSSGNHSWVEIWDEGWRFTGAAEPTDDRLDDGWFVDAASRARGDVPAHAIWATSYAPTGHVFPLAWDEDGSLNWIHGINVTGRYASRGEAEPDGWLEVRFATWGPDGERVPARLEIYSGEELLFEGRTYGPGRDRNDHLGVLLPEGRTVEIRAGSGDASARRVLEVRGDRPLIEIHLASAEPGWRRPPAVSVPHSR